MHVVNSLFINNIEFNRVAQCMTLAKPVSFCILYLTQFDSFPRTFMQC